MRTVAVVTTSRADFGIYRPLLRLILSSDDLRLHLMVSGSHLSPDLGWTVSEIEDEGIPIGDRVEMLLASDTPAGIAASMGLGVIGFAHAFQRFRPDILVVLGDRFEMHAAALAALPFAIPVAHVGGGELTAGAIDESLRHSMTKLAHLHFPATQEYGRRIVQMGEEPWRVTVSGALSLDNLRDFRPLPLDEFARLVGMPLFPRGFLLVTFHPVTLEYQQAGSQTEELLAALSQSGLPAVITLPNADTAGSEVRRRMLAYARQRTDVVAVENLGTRAYFTAMSFAAAMVGNSSSGIVEAPSFGLPVVNIGTRQQGRTRAANVLDVGYGREEITAAIARAITPEFRTALRGLVNPHGDGHGAGRIVARLSAVPLDSRLIQKRFHDATNARRREETTTAGSHGGVDGEAMAPGESI